MLTENDEFLSYRGLQTSLQAKIPLALGRRPGPLFPTVESRALARMNELLAGMPA